MCLQGSSGSPQVFFFYFLWTQDLRGENILVLEAFLHVLLPRFDPCRLPAQMISVCAHILPCPFWSGLAYHWCHLSHKKNGCIHFLYYCNDCQYECALNQPKVQWLLNLAPEEQSNFIILLFVGISFTFLLIESSLLSILMIVDF